MTLTDEQREFRAVIRQFCDDKIAPRAAEVDRSGEYPWDNFEAIRSMDLPALGIPEAYGGAGADHVTQAIMVEELSRVCASTSLIVLISKLGMIPVMNWGSDDLKARYLPRVASGESQASYCLSEADAGHRGISAFVVERDWGVQVAKLEDKMGVRGSPTGEVVFDGVRVPAANRIGEEGDGFRIAMATLDRSRPTIGAQAVGIAQGAIDAAAAYMRERRQFGHPLADFQGLQFMLADMAMKTEAARGLVSRACALIDEGDPRRELTKVGAMAKCFASDTAMAVTTDAIQLLGGYGYVKEFPVERYFRDAKVTQIYEGTNQVQRVVIARRLLG